MATLVGIDAEKLDQGQTLTYLIWENKVEISNRVIASRIPIHIAPLLSFPLLIHIYYLYLHELFEIFEEKKERGRGGIRTGKMVVISLLPRRSSLSEKSEKK